MNTKYLIFTFAALFVLLANMLEPSEPSDIIDNMTVDSHTNMFFEYNTIRYPSSVEITQANVLNNSIFLGFATESWNINFGEVPSNGSYATRTVDISNSNDRDIEVSLKSYGNISKMISFEEDKINLKPGDKTSLSIVLRSESETGFYSGEIDVIIKKPIYNFPAID